MFQATGLILNATTPSPFLERREVVALLRGPSANPTQYLATQDWLRLGQWHRGGTIARMPEPQDASVSEFGAQQSGATTIEIPSNGMALVAPALRFDWVSSETFADRILNLAPTFVRANATATRINSSGYLEGPLAANTPRFDHDPVTLERKGVLFEEARTNLLPYSNTPSSWTQLGTPAATQNLIGPDGVANSAWTLTDNDAAAYEGVAQNVAVANDALTRTFSIHIRKNPGATNTFGLNLGYNGGTVVPATPRFNADTGLIANSGSLFNTVAGWWGWQQSMANNASGNNNFYLNVYPATAVWPAADTVTGQGSHGIYGAQLEVGAFRTSYIPTGAAAATRGVENMYTDSLGWFNPRGGVVVCEFWLGEDTQCGVWQFTDTTANNFIEIYALAGSFYCRVFAGGAQQASIALAGANANQRHRIAFAFAENNFRASLNGGALQYDLAGAMPVLTRAVWGQSIGGGWLNGHIARWAYYAPGRSDADLVSMSTPGVNAWDYGPAQLLKNQSVDLDLITRKYRLDGSVVDFINERRGTVKAVTRTPSGLKLTLVDVDVAALKTLLPIETYTVANFAKLYTDHVNRPVIDGIGTMDKVPCTYIDNTAGAYKYAVCRQRVGQALPTVLTVYRGKSAGKGQIVPATEYVVGSQTVAGVTYVTLTFTREQSDGNQLYEIEADVLGPGSRNVVDEIAYILGLIGISIDTADFADASAYHATLGTMVDACYRQQIEAKAILEPLTQIARGYLSQAVGGLYSIFVDRPRTTQTLLWDDSDQVEVTELTEPELPKTFTLQYRPRPGTRSDYLGDLTRTTAGASGEKRTALEYIRDHGVADRHIDYMAKRAARPRARVNVAGRLFQPGELLAINSPLVFDGWKLVAAVDINRRADMAEIVAEVYADSDYTYTAGTLPADATNAYSPDYTFTPPTAPTSPTATGAAVTVDATGKAFANVLIRAVPPANNNWSRLWVVAKNNVTNALTAPAELTLNAGNYEVRVGNLEPSVSYSFLVYATNVADLAGATATVTQTMPTYSSAPPTPTGQNWLQQAGDTLVFYCDNPTYAHHDRVEWELKVGAGAFVVVPQTGNQLIVTNVAYGATYQAKPRNRDKSGNYSAYPASTLSATPVKQIADAHITTGGVGTGSLADLAVTSGKAGNSSIKQGKLDSSTVSGSVSMANTDILDLCQSTGGYSLCPYVSEGVDIRGHYSSLSSDGLLCAYNDTGSTLTVSYSWIKVLV